MEEQRSRILALAKISVQNAGEHQFSGITRCAKSTGANKKEKSGLLSEARKRPGREEGVPATAQTW